MSGRAYGRLAWAVWALTAALLVVVLLFRSVFRVTEGVAAMVANAGLVVLFAASFSTVGALICTRRPRNAVGWIFVAAGLLAVVAVFTADYAEYGLVTEPGALPYARTAAWVQNWIWPLALSPAALFLLLFPDGTPPSPRWRPVAWTFAAALVVWTVSQALVPGRLVNAGYANATNPYGIETFGGVLRVLGSVSLLLLLVTAVASVASVVVRFRRSTGVEREQIKWVAYASAIMLLSLLAQLTVETTVPESDRLVNFMNLIFSTALTSVPITTAIAILKHGLYDVDRIVNRTLVYAALTGTLVLVYGTSVALLQALFRSLAGGESQLAVVASTLVIAALFNPLRRRIQNLVDRHFYRKRYDAAKTMESFSARLRQETDLGTLREDLIGVVRETVAPEHVSMWLRAEAGGKAAGK